MQLARGQRIKLTDIGLTDGYFSLSLDLHTNGLTVDAACFGLDAHRKLSDERYMTFFNQPLSPCKAVSFKPAGIFDFDLRCLPANIDFLVLTLALDGPGTMSRLGSCQVRIVAGTTTVASFPFSGNDFANERAVMLLEFYRKDGIWRLNAVGQGFDGGLDALVAHFGGEVAPQASVPTISSAAVSLEKRIEAEAPRLVSLVKKVGVSLEKAGLQDHKARVALCLDISGSMASLYKTGQIAAFADRILALACRFDDDGLLDVFLFGKNVHQPEPMSLAASQGYVAELMRRYPLEGNTCYGKAIQAIREYYYPEGHAQRASPISDTMPVYVMFVTDGETSDESKTEKEIRQASFEPIFWQFMGIGKSRKSRKKSLLDSLIRSNFSFLEKLDTMTGRYIDNANFFSVETPEEHEDDILYQLLLSEYKDWLIKARQKNILRT